MKTIGKCMQKSIGGKMATPTPPLYTYSAGRRM